MRSSERVGALMVDAVGPVFPAAQLVIVDGGKVVYEQVVGEAVATTQFDLASLTKPLSTTALALRLIAAGKLSLDDRPRPESTIAALLSHSAGLPGWRALADPAHPGEAARTQAIEAARVEPLEYAPGEKSVYSDLGFILVGDAIERATGARLDVLFKEHVADRHEVAVRFGPIADAAPTEGDLRGVVHDENCRAMGGVAGHAGLFGDAAAVSKLVGGWVDAWHGEGPCVSAGWVQRAWTRSGVPGSTWGLGWDHPNVLHSSAGLRWPRDGVGHLAFTGCSIWVDPPRRRWTVLLSNRVHPTRANEAIKSFRPTLGDAIVAMLDG